MNFGQNGVSLCPVTVFKMSSLSAEQLKAVQLLGEDWNQADVARKLKISTKTIQRWLKKPEFQKALEDLQQRTTEKFIESGSEHIATRIQSLLPKSLDVLEEILINPALKPADRLQAARLIGTWSGLGQQKIHPEAQPKTPTTGLSEQLVEQIRLKVLGVNNAAN